MGDWDSLYSEHADLVGMVARDLRQGTFVYRACGTHAVREHVGRTLGGLVDRVFAVGVPGSTFRDEQEMCDALQCLIFHEYGPCKKFLGGFTMGLDRRFRLSGTSARIHGVCVRLDHGILRAGVTHSARAILTMSSHCDNAYGGLKLITCYPDASKMRPVPYDGLSDIVHKTSTYRNGSQVTRLWMDLSVWPLTGQRETRHTREDPEELEIDVMDGSATLRVRVAEGSLSCQTYDKRGERATDRAYDLCDPTDVECLMDGPHARCVAEVRECCLGYLGTHHPDLQETGVRKTVWHHDLM